MIYALIPVFNRIEYTINCVNSILEQNESIDIRIIIVDDGSTDGTLSILTELFGSSVIILQGTGKLYWTGAICFGINYILSRCKIDDYILLINNDVVLARNALQELLCLAKAEKNNSIVGAISINPLTKTVIKSGTIVNSWFFNISFHVLKGLSQASCANLPPIKVDFITARCLLHPVKVFLCAGNYDAMNFIHYAADDEFSMRIKKYGFDSIVCPSSIVFAQGFYSDQQRLPSLRFWDVLFSKLSSSNIANKCKLSMSVAPAHAKITYLFFGLLKSLMIALGNELRLLDYRMRTIGHRRKS